MTLSSRQGFDAGQRSVAPYDYYEVYGTYLNCMELYSKAVSPVALHVRLLLHESVMLQPSSSAIWRLDSSASLRSLTLAASICDCREQHCGHFAAVEQSLHSQRDPLSPQKAASHETYFCWLARNPLLPARPASQQSALAWQCTRCRDSEMICLITSCAAIGNVLHVQAGRLGADAVAAPIPPEELVSSSTWFWPPSTAPCCLPRLLTCAQAHALSCSALALWALLSALQMHPVQTCTRWSCQKGLARIPTVLGY